MTVINFNQVQQEHSQLWILIGFWSVVVATAGFMLVYIYNGGVDMRYEVKQGEAHLQKAIADNADKKVHLYGLLTPQALDAIAQAHGLVKEVHPQYRGIGDGIAVVGATER